MTDDHRNYPFCSRCGSLESLKLITFRYDDSSDAGRVLVYCSECHDTYKNMIGISIPLQNLTPEIFLDLYRAGKTQSEPHTAVNIAFGREKPEIIRKAEFILSEFRANGPNVT